MPEEWSATIPARMRGSAAVKTLHDAVTLTSGGMIVNSASLNVERSRKFALFNRVSESGTTSGQTLEAQVQFSPNNTDWFDYVNGPFGVLLYEGVQVSGILYDVQIGDIAGPYVRVQLEGQTSLSTNRNLQATVKFLPF